MSRPGPRGELLLVWPVLRHKNHRSLLAATRLAACELHIGLDHVAFTAFSGREVEPLDGVERARWLSHRNRKRRLPLARSPWVIALVKNRQHGQESRRCAWNPGFEWIQQMPTRGALDPHVISNPARPAFLLPAT